MSTKTYVDMSLGQPIFYHSYQQLPLPKGARQVSKANYDAFVAGQGTFDAKGKFVVKKGAK